MIRRAAIALLQTLTALGLPVLGAMSLNAQSIRDVDGELALAVAKVAANEASLQSIRPAEVALIYQCAEARSSSTAGRLRWLRAHSSCVLTDRPMTDEETRGNCVWSRFLEDSDAEPANFPEQLHWPRHAHRWAQVRELARRLVDGREPFRPCRGGDPFTWGGRRLDMEQALERGLRPLDCRDADGVPTINEGFALAGGRS